MSTFVISDMADGIFDIHHGNISVVIDGGYILLICRGCREIPVDPVQAPCGHKYCRQCIPRHCIGCLEENEETLLTQRDVVVDLSGPRDLQKTVVTCRMPECDWRGIYSRFSDNHVTAHHDTERVACPLGCKAELTPLQTVQHLHPIYGTCPRRPCPFGCPLPASREHLIANLGRHSEILEKDLAVLREQRSEADDGYQRGYEEAMQKMHLLTHQTRLAADGMRGCVKDSAAHVQNITNQVGLLKGCLNDLLAGMHLEDQPKADCNLGMY